MDIEGTPLPPNIIIYDPVSVSLHQYRLPHLLELSCVAMTSMMDVFAYCHEVLNFRTPIRNPHLKVKPRPR